MVSVVRRQPLFGSDSGCPLPLGRRADGVIHQHRAAESALLRPPDEWQLELVLGPMTERENGEKPAEEVHTFS